MIFSFLASSPIFASFCLRRLLTALYIKSAKDAVDSVARPYRNIAEMVGPCSSRRWNPELDSIVVGLSIRTFGCAATAGVDDVCPIVDVLDVDRGDPCCNFDVCGSGGDVVPR